MTQIYAVFWLIITTASSHGVATTAVPMPDQTSCTIAAKSVSSTSWGIATSITQATTTCVPGGGHQ